MMLMMLGFRALQLGGFQLMLMMLGYWALSKREVSG